jgi:hypothetical protein
MRRRDLTTLILQHVTHRTLQHAGTAAAVCVESRGVLTQFAAAATASTPIILTDSSDKKG